MKRYDRIEGNVRIALLAANLLDGMADRNLIVNLGLGYPTLIADYLNNPRVFFHAENGMVGVGPRPEPRNENPDLVNAGLEPVTLTPGCVFFDSTESFSIIRGGHIDVTVIGAFEVDSGGHIANWIIPGADKLGVGGAMDLVCGSKTVIVAMSHFSKRGSKLVEKCSLPLTGNRTVDYVVTEYGIFHFVDGQFYLVAVAEDVDIEELQNLTDVEFILSTELKRCNLPT